MLGVLRKPFLESGFCVGKPLIIGEILPLVRIFGGIVELFTAVGISDVMPLFGTNGMIVAVTNHRRSFPLAFRQAKQGHKTASIQSIPLR